MAPKTPWIIFITGLAFLLSRHLGSGEREGAVSQGYPSSPGDEGREGAVSQGYPSSPGDEGRERGR